MSSNVSHNSRYFTIVLKFFSRMMEVWTLIVIIIILIFAFIFFFHPCMVEKVFFGVKIFVTGDFDEFSRFEVF